MHPDLSPHLHTEECNELIKILHDCHSNNKFKKFLGVCTTAHNDVFKCLMREREFNRQNNPKRRGRPVEVKTDVNV